MFHQNMALYLSIIYMHINWFMWRGGQGLAGPPGALGRNDGTVWMGAKAVTDISNEFASILIDM